MQTIALSWKREIDAIGRYPNLKIIVMLEPLQSRNYRENT